jgi:hypothetical protein
MLISQKMFVWRMTVCSGYKIFFLATGAHITCRYLGVLKVRKFGLLIAKISKELLIFANICEKIRVCDFSQKTW